MIALWLLDGSYEGHLPFSLWKFFSTIPCSLILQLGTGLTQSILTWHYFHL